MPLQDFQDAAQQSQPPIPFAPAPYPQPSPASSQGGQSHYARLRGDLLLVKMANNSRYLGLAPSGALGTPANVSVLATKLTETSKTVSRVSD